ncbi:hypothetical protein Vadar_017979 [Vaccinium darrowii]|uniref:Uncharacterized protein n=1 Tax=Vaccinium darrowii TaxID=229202 RepID=A0ACB7ZK78_9ERIC|nr:hypothetical protein Vadar_017979 [Vaccinium darrowii]
MNTDYTQHRLLLISPGDDVKSCSLRAVLHENSDTAVEIDCPNRPILVVGCCDGLVCMEIKRRVFLWNPSTWEFMTLPFVEMPYPYYLRSYGFAYDESIDDYKETYGEVLEPEYGDDCMHEIVLEVSNGCLCIVLYCDSNACVEVWIMKEYGIKESWTKLFVIPNLSHPSERILCILKNGEVLLRIQKQLCTFSHLTVHNFSACLRAYPYVEGLVSPHIDADRADRWQATPVLMQVKVKLDV